MKLYWGAGSPFAWRAMLSLIVKGADFDDELLEFSKGQHKAPEYVKLNPRAKLPTLVDGDTIVCESLAIIAYVDRRFPDPPLYGTTPAQAGAIAQLIAEHENYIGTAARGVARPAFQGKVKEQAESVRESATALALEMERLERALAHQPWLAGDKISAADLVHYPTIMTLERAATKPELAELDIDASLGGYPKLSAWKDRLTALPGVDRAFPPHWRA